MTHKLAYEELKKGARASKLSKRYVLRLEKKELQLTEQKQMLDFAKTALLSPVLAGTLAFFVVEGIEKLSKQAQPAASTAQQQQSSTPQAPSGPLGDLVNLLLANPLTGGALGSLFTAGTTIAGANKTFSPIFGSVDFAALKAAILLYIASGGNLAGLLASSGSFITSLAAAGAAK